MGDALKRELGDAVDFAQPQGGPVLLGPADRRRRQGRGRQRASRRRRSRRAWPSCPARRSMRTTRMSSTFRLSFATADVAKIEEGMGRLGKAIQ